MFHPFTTIHGFQAYPGMSSAGIYLGQVDRTIGKYDVRTTKRTGTFSRQIENK